MGCQEGNQEVDTTCQIETKLCTSCKGITFFRLPEEAKWWQMMGAWMIECPCCGTTVILHPKSQTSPLV